MRHNCLPLLFPIRRERQDRNHVWLLNPTCGPAAPFGLDVARYFEKRNPLTNRSWETLFSSSTRHIEGCISSVAPPGQSRPVRAGAEFGQPATPPVPFFASYILTTDFQDAEDHRMPININGSFIDLPSDTRVSLLDLLRDHLDLAGTKKGCNQGACLKTQR